MHFIGIEMARTFFGENFAATEIHILTYLSDVSRKVSGMTGTQLAEVVHCSMRYQPAETKTRTALLSFVSILTHPNYLTQLLAVCSSSR